MKTEDSTIRNYIKFYGEQLWEQQLISFLAGNISVLYNHHHGDKKMMYITKRGAALSFLKDSDIVVNDILTTNDSKWEDDGASSEFGTHLAIYNGIDSTKNHAIIHAHPPISIAMTRNKYDYKFKDLEGRYYIGQFPILEEGGDIVDCFSKGFKIIMLENHGVFAVGENLKECFSLISTLEHSMKIAYYEK